MFIVKSIGFSDNTTLLDQLYAILAPSYVDCTALLKREAAFCKEIYLLYSDSRELIAFFMVNNEKIDDIDTYYLGLSGCHNDYKQLGFGKALYVAFLGDLRMREAEMNTRIVCWWTTASPVPFHWFNKNMEDCAPSLEGHVSDRSLGLMRKIVAHKYSQVSISPDIPFVLPRVADRTQYSNVERERLNRARKNLEIGAFEKYPIQEHEGDRYLMIGYAPGWPSVECVTK